MGSVCVDWKVKKWDKVDKWFNQKLTIILVCLDFFTLEVFLFGSFLIVTAEDCLVDFFLSVDGSFLIELPTADALAGWEFPVKLERTICTGAALIDGVDVIAETQTVSGVDTGPFSDIAKGLAWWLLLEQSTEGVIVLPLEKMGDMIKLDWGMLVDGLIWHIDMGMRIIEGTSPPFNIAAVELDGDDKGMAVKLLNVMGWVFCNNDLSWWACKEWSPSTGLTRMVDELESVMVESQESDKFVYNYSY